MKFFFKNKIPHLADFIFPKYCLDCGREGDFFCSDCLGNLNFKAEQTCPVCRKITPKGMVCPNCREQIFLSGLLSAGKDPILKKAIKTCKYRYCPEIAEVLGDFLSEFWREVANKKDGETPSFFRCKNILLVCVPLHKKRENRRGFNQARILAEKMSARFGFEIAIDLVRQKNNSPQANLQKENRFENIKDCFVWQGGSLATRKILIVDDIATTGATMGEAAKILKQAGAGEIWGLSLY